MSVTVLIIGDPGTGKSTAIKTLNPKETFIINILGQTLPFKGGRKYYKASANLKESNIYATDEWLKIISIIKLINEKKTNIKNLIIDDFQYLMGNEYMDRADEKGWEKFSQIAQHAWKVIRTASFCRENLNIFFLSHSTKDDEGIIKCKTIGKMLDEKIDISGMFTIVLYSFITENKYLFLTQNNGKIISKSPMGMFKDKFIPNDLQFVTDKINKYYNEDIDTDKSNEEKNND